MRGAQTLEMPTGATGARVAGFIGSSMLDWPGRIAATVFLAGCTLRCPYCHNPELITTTHRSSATIADILGHVSRRRSWLDGVVVTGGEPTSDPALPGLLRALRDEGLPIKLDSNGTAPEVLGELLAEGLVDFVALDVKAAPERYERVTGMRGAWPLVATSIDAVITSGVDHEFRTTCYPPAVALPDLTSIASNLVGGKRLVLQQFRAQRTLDAAAATVASYSSGELDCAARRCSPYLPTVLRGV